MTLSSCARCRAVRGGSCPGNVVAKQIGGRFENLAR